jgi:hypothetical protein
MGEIPHSGAGGRGEYVVVKRHDWFDVEEM